MTLNNGTKASPTAEWKNDKDDNGTVTSKYLQITMQADTTAINFDMQLQYRTDEASYTKKVLVEAKAFEEEQDITEAAKRADESKENEVTVVWEGQTASQSESEAADENTDGENALNAVAEENQYTVYFQQSKISDSNWDNATQIYIYAFDNNNNNFGNISPMAKEGESNSQNVWKYTFNKAWTNVIFLTQSNWPGDKSCQTVDLQIDWGLNQPCFQFKDEKGNSVKDIYAYPKNSTGTATIDKKIVKSGTDKATTTANIGDTINYKVTYSIPVGENGLESLVVTDTMSKGLTFVNNPDNIKVLNGNEEVDRTMYTVKDSKDDSTKVTTITITFNSDKYCKTLDKNTTQNFTITYTATLNKDAVLGQSGNTNDVFVTYRNTGDVDRETEPKGTPKVFTYGIDLLKKGEGNTVLKEVEFKLTDGNNEIKVKQSGNAYYPSKDGDASSTVTTDNDGKIYIRGLKPGTYKLTETKTNAGYVLLKDPVVIAITEDSTTPGVATAMVGTKEVTMNADNGSATAIVPLTVVNSKGFDLPTTGGRGIALFTIAGIAIVAAAGSLLFMRKRSK